MGSQLGIRKRNIAPDQGVTERVFNITVPEKVGTSAVNHDYRFQVSSTEDVKLVAFSASANTMGGFTTLTINISSPTAALITTPIDMVGKAGQIVPGTLASSPTVTAGGAVWVSIRSTGGPETYSDLLITARFRPLLGSETRL